MRKLEWETVGAAIIVKFAVANLEGLGLDQSQVQQEIREWKQYSTSVIATVVEVFPLLLAHQR